ncbi:Increased DNA methylation 1 [Camellia lanceoleosa]|uniref:Increased DNA methylation 1 n=1 Tax=Camellia lanceoleosa TaxID=1840588 RepID=A0ACC0IEC4_9ERIC|nr:Increased DNA methylation 1 [Camellia lanceoleosa]
MIRKDGILCDCCHEIFTTLDFEAHAESGDLKGPYKNIFINEELRISLLSCLREAWDMIEQIEQDKLKDVVPKCAWLYPYCVCKFSGNPCGLYPYCVYEKLKEMVGVRNELDEGFSWTLLQQMNEEFGVQLDDLYKTIECHSKLAVARIVMEDCFEPITDRYTRINIIQNVVYNRNLVQEKKNNVFNIAFLCKSNYTRTNFRGFYSAILEKDGEIISVASVRIHRTKLAEMPFIATCESYRSQGMCRKLFKNPTTNFHLKKKKICSLLPQSRKHGHTLHSRENWNMDRKIWFSMHWTLTKQRNKVSKYLNIP